ncbi:Eco57I restriction-modification methylase domain-containing protein [candidate division KSB1 bacterium]
MPESNDIREDIIASLKDFNKLPVPEAARRLFATLGYKSDRTVQLGDSTPHGFLDFIRSHSAGSSFDEKKALVPDWKSADLLFQLTDEELSGHLSLFKETSVDPGLLRSYLFFAIELTGENHAVGGNYARGKLTGIARQINRVFPMPVMVLIKHRFDKNSVLSIAVINRRQSKRDENKDVLGKVTIIRNISLTNPHRGHLDILRSFAFSNLVHPQRLLINNFDTLHAAWEEIFNVELLNKRFYRELANWYFWALPQVDFPDDIEKDDEKRRATSLIRLLTRIIFCWFVKEKGLIPEKLFIEAELEEILTNLDPEANTYYQAILQNLFFATLNQRMGKDKNGRHHRAFARDEGFQKNRATYGIDTLYRYEEQFREPATALELFADVPFLNGGLFECLDRTDEGTNKKLYLDGFSRNKKKRPNVPNRLFFSEEHTVDLSDAYGETRRRNEKVRGLLHILHSYKFTIVENTPIDQEIALDPELLGKVFENLLASYNEETKTTARKQTGSFYTPRTIVEYMVDESLQAHLARALIRVGMKVGDARVGLDILFAYTEREHCFTESEVDTLLEAIHTCKTLDPACGSGAFPMGMLHKLVYIIHKLDPDNTKWKQLQIDAAAKILDISSRDAAMTAIKKDFAEHEDDYGRKLYLIENCMYGVDIQPIAIQIAKLRFFVSLICDQRTNRNKQDNFGIRPLPNLETKFVAADTLIGLPEMKKLLLVNPRVYEIEKEIKDLYHSHFSIQRRDQKLALQKIINMLREELRKVLAKSVMSPAKSQQVAAWDPFDPQARSDFFDPIWMFGPLLADGFDIVLGNPPYIQIQKFSVKRKAIWKEQDFETYSATADIYCLFYERGAQLLKNGGRLCYITMNRWMRAGYGEILRRFFLKKVDLTKVFDFGMGQNFDASTTLTCIVQFIRQPPSGKTLSCYATDETAAMADPAGYFEHNHVQTRHLSSDPWVILSKDRQRIKDLVEAQGVPLALWDIQIFRGVLTGFNDAFYVTQEQRDAFIAKDPKCEELLVPLLRGRNIARYATDWDGMWMIASFPAYSLKQSNLPGPILAHLSKYRNCLEPKPKNWGTGKWDGRKSGSYKWFEIQDVIGYYREFSKPKIMYPNMTKYLPFYLDNKGEFFTNDKGFIITSDSESLHYIMAFLNSHLFRCCFRDNFPELMGNTYEVRKIFVEKIPLRKPSEDQSTIFEKLVSLVQLTKRLGEDAPGAFLEDLIDACVMECYFRDHMAERDLLFLDDLAPHLTGYDLETGESKQRDFLVHCYRALNAPDSKIRNRLLRLTADSPDLLAVIKEEGRV